ncbi:GNAT family N-acetyltransferase [Cronobacter turicensis]|uniref:GNAT family N-acetyltransferase n=1 Tax=Cronobacter turicensis TaxID=413502 RepID=UPI000CFB05F4|nr:GNAT family N-acetyltransferase [Cronobacter turicensis]EKM0666983.1 GNAT family N-acetyltransferase [Cronobacter turicensis]EKY3176140.1 GNAT family N-acetyltransferase [Cronobacter turicensis]ELY4521783.1 GNAT family N-acetyltransferase [Cronobacter turicensis]ELY4572592.1 GNAT family N-acetyltransferase [Cronobacter turicensis]ELY4608115.1 GNAT family N-acetyltransferase [Cronobacter turicensis]
MSGEKMIIKEFPPSAEDFCRLRALTKLSPRGYEHVVRALPASLYGVHIIADDQVIAMGRVVGDGVINFEIVDVAVHPSYQGKGYGKVIMEHIMKYLGKTAAPGAYITLMADVPELYEKFGFRLSRPCSEGMYMNWNL